MAKGVIVTLRVRSHTQSGAVGFGAFGGLRYPEWVFIAPLGTAVPVAGGQVAGGMPSLLGNFYFALLRSFRSDGTHYIAEPCAGFIIAKLFVLAQHHHVYTEVYVKERWGQSKGGGNVVVRSGMLIPVGH